MQNLRSSSRRLLAAIAVVGLAATPILSFPPVGGVEPVAADVVRSGAVSWVTLITGDRVSVADRGGAPEVAAVEPGPGRDGMQFARHGHGGRMLVVPMDAVPLVGQGTLDPRLFDVAALVRAGYDDRSRSDIPLIVSGGYPSGPATTRTRSRLEAIEPATVTRELPSVSGFAVSERKDEATRFWDALMTGTGTGPAPRAEGRLTPEVTKVWLDGPVEVTLDESVPQVGAPTAWAAGHTGSGAVVAVLDTGIDATHPDLADAVVTAEDFTGDPDGASDGHGHGTHVASIITGSGAASGERYAGVAPDARLLVGKVLDDFGQGFESQVITGMEWAAAQDAPVVNMSLGGPVPDAGIGPMDEAVNRLTAETGTLFVVAAGNAGPGEQTIMSPGTADAALTVGAVDGGDEPADFSGRGPRRGDAAIKPDLTAPGVDIVAARAEGTSLGDPVDGRHTSLSGTSMATPHVAGAAAILAGQRPEWGAAELEGVLVGSADPQDGRSVYEQGAGRLDVARADAQPVHATPASIGGGVARWPHEDDEPVLTPVTYHNPGAEPLTLDLSLDVTNERGAAAPAGMFTTSAAQITVPAGGEVTVTVAIDTAVPGEDGLYGGRLNALVDDGRIVVRTPIGVEREEESYDVTVQAVDSSGRPTDFYQARFVDLEEDVVHQPYDPSGTVVVRLPRGSYYVDLVVWSSAPDGSNVQAALVEPTFDVDADSTLMVDPRRGRPVRATVDRPDAAVSHFYVEAARLTPSGPVILGLSGANVLLRPSDTAAPAGQFSVDVFAMLARADGTGGFAGSPYLYHVHWSRTRRVPRRLAHHAVDRDLAVVRSTHASASIEPSIGVRDGGVTMRLPATLTEYYTPGVPWPSSFSTETLDGVGTTFQLSTYRTFRLGQRYRERWNSGVFGPAETSLPSPFGAPQVARFDDVLQVWVPLFSDQASNHLGGSIVDSRSVRLFHDGEQIGEWPLPFDPAAFAVPPDEGAYRLEIDATRSVSDLSTRVTVAWTFRSGHVDGDDLVPVPLLGIRFAPRLDEHNRAPSGRRFRVPVHIGRQPDAPYGILDSVTVEASYDDGRTWVPARISGRGDDRTATLTHPAGPGYVSLRATATDSAGNRVEQTIIRAYAITDG